MGVLYIYRRELSALLQGDFLGWYYIAPHILSLVIYKLGSNTLPVQLPCLQLPVLSLSGYLLTRYCVPKIESIIKSTIAIRKSLMMMD